MAEKACTLHHGGKFYNLNPLSSRNDYALKSLGGHEFILNVCKSVSHETWALKVPDPADVGGFIRLDHGDFSIGSVSNTTLAMRGSTPVLQLSSGSTCSIDSRLTASTTIQFICKRHMHGTGHPTLIAQLPPKDEDACAFFLEWHTPFACPTSMSRLWIVSLVVVLSMLIGFLILYLVCGILYNRFVLKLTGFDQIPQFSWTSLKYHASAVWEIVSDTLHILRKNYQDFCFGATGSRTDKNTNLGISHHWNPGSDGLPSMVTESGDMHGNSSSGCLAQVPASNNEEGSGSTGKGMDSSGVIRL